MFSFLNQRFYTPQIQNFSHAQTTAVKGMLMLFVMISHITLFTTASPHFYAVFTFFHVAAFFLLPFIYEAKPLSLALVKQWVPRFFIPFFIFALLEAVLFYFLLMPAGDRGSWPLYLVQAVTIQSAFALDQATGLQTLWFLPAYFTTMVLVAFFIGRLKVPVIVLVLVSGAIYGCIGWIPEAYKFWIPLGILPAAIVFFLGIMTRLTLSAVPPDKLKLSFWFFLAAFIGLEIICLLYFKRYSLSKLLMSGLDQPLDVFAHVALIVSAFLALLTAPGIAQSRFVSWVGKNSLFIFLIHQLIYHALLIVAGKLGMNVYGDLIYQFVMGGLFLGMTLVGCFIAVTVLDRMPWLRRFLMPRDFTDWPLARFVTGK